MNELFLLCLRLGFTAFGGPAAHIAMLENEVVEKRKWINSQEFLELMAFTNIIPGPNSSEMVMAVGYHHSKRKGLIVAGFAFILPAILITSLITLFFISSDLSVLETLTLAVTPLLIVIIASALIKLIKKQEKSFLNILLFISALSLKLLNVNEIIIFILAGLLYLIADKLKTIKLLIVEPISLFVIFLSFFKIGSTLYGSGYVLMSYLKTEFVDTLRILTEQQITQAFAIGELTPGPVFTTATSLGIMMANIPGGIIASIGIFIPSFTFMLLLMPFKKKLSSNQIIKKILQGISIAALAIMTHVVIDLLLSISNNSILISFLLINSLIVYKSKMNSMILLPINAVVYFLVTALI